MAALFFLFRLKSIGGIRRLWRSCKTIQGAIKALFTVSFLALLCLPLIMLTIQHDSKPVPTEIIATTRYMAHNAFPLMLTGLFFVFLIAPKTDPSLDFQPAEIDFLFSGPFSRRELVIYKLLGTVTSTLAISAGITVFLGGIFFLFGQPVWITFLRGFATLFLSFLLFQLTLTLSALIRKSFIVRLVSPIQKGGAALLVLSVWLAFYSIRDELKFDLLTNIDPVKFAPVLKSLIASDWCQIAITPARIFSNLLLSNSIGESLFWGAAGLSLNAFMVVLILLTDRNFLETELNISRKKAELAKRQSKVDTAFIIGNTKGTLPMLPFMNGIGPVAWRQLQTFYRTRTFIVGGLIVYFLFLAFMIWTDQNSDSSANRFAVTLAMIVSISFIGPILLPMGFQNDLNKMDIFKSLPFSSWQIAAGQMIGPAIVLVAVQLATIFIFLFTALDYAGNFFALAMFTPLITLVVLGVVNTLSLLYPSRKEKGIVNQFENIGHILIFVFLLGTVGGIILGLLGSVGGTAYFLTKSIFVTLIACWIVMLIAAIAGVLMTGWAFDRFDVTKHLS